jgi:microcystin degradation protein MlrC
MAMFDCRMMGIYPTNPQPMRGFVDAMMAAERGPVERGGDGVLSLSLGHGFPWGDVPDSGARMLAVVDGVPSWPSPRAEALGPRFHALRREVAVRPLPLDAALDRALAVLGGGRGPVVIADQADNAGGGAPSPTAPSCCAACSSAASRAPPWR